MKIAFLSMNNLNGYVTDDELAIEPLQKLGHTVEIIPWQKTNVEWKEYTAAVIRSTWDYQNHLQEFLQVLKQIESQTLLANPFEIANWNADKIYLKDVAQKGATIVPTIWSENKIDNTQIQQWFKQLQCEQLVIKPRVSATAQNTFWLKQGKEDVAMLSKIFQNRPFMVQPFMPQIVKEGEYSLFYFNGEYSHTILKTPKTNDFRVQEEHGGIIQAVEPTNNLLASSKKILNCIASKLLYVRIDLVSTGNNDFALMELELIEPSLYLRTTKEAPYLFAQAINEWVLENQSLSSSKFTL